MPKTPTKKKSSSSKSRTKKKSAPKSNKGAAPSSIPAVRATFTRATAETSAATRPAPQLCPKGEVGNVVQDFIDFGGAASVTSTEQPDGQWLVQAL